MSRWAFPSWNTGHPALKLHLFLLLLLTQVSGRVTFLLPGLLPYRSHHSHFRCVAAQQGFLSYDAICFLFLVSLPRYFRGWWACFLALLVCFLLLSSPSFCGSFSSLDGVVVFLSFITIFLLLVYLFRPCRHPLPHHSGPD